MIKGIFGLLLVSSVVCASDAIGTISEQASSILYKALKKKWQTEAKRELAEVDTQIADAPNFDKVDLTPFQIQIGNRDVFIGYGYDYRGNRVSQYRVEFTYAHNIQQVVDRYLKNPNLPLTAEQTDPSRVFSAPQPDPKRPGYDYTGIESGYVSIISRALPSGYAIGNDDVNGESAAKVLMKALLWKVFSPERAIALYNDVIMQMGEEDPEEQKKAYEGMAEELGISALSDEGKKAKKKQIRQEARKTLEKAKRDLGLK